jgi:hypothetical protein
MANAAVAECFFEQDARDAGEGATLEALMARARRIVHAYTTGPVELRDVAHDEDADMIEVFHARDPGAFWAAAPWPRGAH